MQTATELYSDLHHVYLIRSFAITTSVGSSGKAFRHAALAMYIMFGAWPFILSRTHSSKLLGPNTPAKELVAVSTPPRRANVIFPEIIFFSPLSIPSIIALSIRSMEVSSLCRSPPRLALAYLLLHPHRLQLHRPASPQPVKPANHVTAATVFITQVSAVQITRCH